MGFELFPLACHNIREMHDEKDSRDHGSNVIEERSRRAVRKSMSLEATDIINKREKVGQVFCVFGPNLC